MKILIVQDFLRSGGTERQSILLANAWAAAGHATTLLTFRPGGKLASTVAPSVTRHALQAFDFGLDWYAPRLRATATALAPDVILCMGRMANCYGASLQSSHPRPPVIATLRTGKPLPALFRRSLHRVRHVVANSSEARNALTEKYQVPPQKTSVIHNALVFPAGAVTGAAEDHRARYGATAATKIFLCVAMFRPEKNQRELIEIMAGLPATLDWQLWLAGEGPARRACEDLVAQQQLGARVKFLGFQAAPTALYQCADVAVHASWSEALSNFLIEAQAAGLPAVVYQAQGMEECFIPGVTGWAVAREDRATFRTNLLQLISTDPITSRKRADQAAKFARDTFDPDRQVAAYLQLFRQLSPP